MGLFYGTRLLNAEVHYNEPLDVSFLLRRDYQFVVEAGIEIKSFEKPLTFTPTQLQNKIFKTTDEILNQKGTMDWVIICLKGYSLNEQVCESMKCVVDSRTKFLVIMNGLGVEEPVSTFFGKQNVFGAIAFICANRDLVPTERGSPLIVHHLLAGKLEVGHVLDDAGQLQAAEDLWRRTGVGLQVTVSECLLRSRWLKSCWNIPFSGLAVAMGGLTTDVIARDPSLRRLADAILDDTLRVANADITHWFRSTDPAPGVECPFLLDEAAVKQHMWFLTDGAGAYRASTVLDLVQGAQLEIEYLFQQPLVRAERLRREFGVQVEFGFLQSLVWQIEGVARMAREKRESGTPWHPVLFR